MEFWIDCYNFVFMRSYLEKIRYVIESQNLFGNKDFDLLAMKFLFFSFEESQNKKILGYCDYESRTIGISRSNKRTKYTTQTADGWVDGETHDCITFCHECGHAIMYGLGITNESYDLNENRIGFYNHNLNTLSGRIAEEQLVDTIGYQIYLMLYGDIDENFFKSFHTVWGKESIRDYYGNSIIQDIQI